MSKEKSKPSHIFHTSIMTRSMSKAQAFLRLGDQADI